MDLNALSEQLLFAVKLQRATSQLEKGLQSTSMADLQRVLATDEQKKAFWINLYNAFFLILRRDRQIDKPAIYREKLIAIAGQRFSLDDIEHGILRRYRLKWALGYLPDPFAPGLIKKLAVQKRDYRIHFALNCGARSCPPIAFYSAGKLYEQLELATVAFLESETEWRPEQKEVWVTRLFQWYRGDFGGRRGIRHILLKKLGLDAGTFRIHYREYNWQEDLSNFREL